MEYEIGGDKRDTIDFLVHCFWHIIRFRVVLF